MSTVRQIITNSLILAGVYQQGESPSANDMNLCQIALENLEDSWSNDNLLLFNRTELVFSVQAGKQTYTLGPSTIAAPTDWDAIRPMNIIAMNSRQFPGTIQQIDLPITPLTTQQWAACPVKDTTGTLPLSYYDDSAYPNRNITLWPVPQTNIDIVLWTYQPMDVLTNLDQVVDFPPGYKRAFIYSLAIEICPLFGKDVPDIVGSVAAGAVDKLKVQNATVPTWRFESGINSSLRSGVPFWWNHAGGFLF